MAQAVNILVLVKNSIRHVYVYDQESRTELAQAIREAAANPEVALSWFDASVLIQRARQQSEESSYMIATPDPE
ncbi:MAG: hypothetical protein R3B84_19320 [Zavarzinella sp.]